MKIRVIKGFIKRHNLTTRNAANVKSSRAEMSAEIIQEFLDNLNKVAESVEPCNFYNYDETNIRDEAMYCSV